MAAVAATVLNNTRMISDNRRGLKEVTVRTVALGTGSAAEWIAAATLGLSWITSIVGVVVIGDTTSTSPLAFMKNAQGTGVAEGTNAGDLGIESTDAGINVVEVTVQGVSA
jgi:hypothetical protein